MFLPPVCLSSFVFLSNLQQQLLCTRRFGVACCLLCPVSPRRDQPGARGLLHRPKTGVWPREGSAQLYRSCCQSGAQRNLGVFPVTVFPRAFPLVRFGLALSEGPNVSSVTCVTLSPMDQTED